MPVDAYVSMAVKRVQMPQERREVLGNADSDRGEISRPGAHGRARGTQGFSPEVSTEVEERVRQLWAG
jgi:hypothetical protein